jgi:uncharacterized damage-inducible protein DinB
MEVKAYIQQLRDQMDQTLAILEGASEADLSRPDSHGCAVGGTLGGLLKHNIEHDLMHLGQIATKRWEQGAMQSDAATRLMAELYRTRAALIASLFGLTDAQLDHRVADGETTIREVIEHVLYWENDSMQHAAREVLEKSR